MARNKSTAQTPAVRHLRYELTNSGSPDTETSHYIDLARDISRVNRRLYRQGRDYHVKKITIVSSNTIIPPNVSAGRISVSTIPNTWVAREAWKRGFQVWNHMNKVATENVAGDIAGTWSDFKIYIDNGSRTGNYLDPKDNGGNNYNAGEWIHSKYVSPDGTTGADPFFMHMMGDHSGSAGAWNSISLIKSYGESRATVQNADPNVPSLVSDDPLVNVFDYGTTIDEVVDYLETDNDDPPYDINDYPGGNANGPKPMVVQDTALSLGSATLGSFTSICGLLELECKSPIANDVYSVLVELAPGKYRGIKADVI